MESLLAAIVLAVCIVLLARLLVGERRRYRFDAALRRGWQPVRRAWHSAQRGVASVRQRRRAERNTMREAEEAIRRARRPASDERAEPPAGNGKANGRGNGRWDGNVFHPDSPGDRPRKPH